MSDPDLGVPVEAAPAPPEASDSGARRALRIVAWPFWNWGERRPRLLLRLLLLGVALNLISTLVRLAYTAPPDIARNLFIVGVLRGGIALVAILLVTWLVDRRPLQVLGLQVTRPRWWLEVALGTALGALLMAGIFGWERIAGWMTVSGMYAHDGAGSFGAGLMAGFLGFLGAGFFEEILFRSYLLRNLADGLRPRGRMGASMALMLGTVLSSALFGYVHASNEDASLVSTINVAVAGVLLALPYVVTGRLAFSTGFHVAWNFFQGPIFGFPVSGLDMVTRLFVIEVTGPEVWTGGKFGPEAGLVGLAAMAVGALLIVLWLKRSEGHVDPCADLLEPRPAAATLAEPAPAAAG